MSKPFTKAMIDEFDKLTCMTSSHSQMDRIRGRLTLKKFIDTHGKDVCDIMFAELQALDDAKRKKGGRK